MSHYDTLEVVPHASAETIRAAYRSLMQRHHPDRHPGDAAMAARAARITQAYDVLSDPQRRAAYDALHEAAQAVPDVAERAGPMARADTATAAAQALAARRARVQAGREAARGETRSATPWLLWIALALLVGGLGLWWGKGLGRGPAMQDLDAMRRAVESPDTLEAKRRELLALKQQRVERDARLQRAEQEERIRDLAGRSFTLLEAPLLVAVGSAREPAGNAVRTVAEIEIPQITLVVGSFESGRMLAELDRQRPRFIEELRQHLAQEDATVLTRSDVERQLKRIVLGSVLASAGIDSAQTYPSTWFESPGRHGVVDVLLPRGFELRRLQSY